VKDIVKDLQRAADPVRFASGAVGFDPDPWQVEALRSASKRILLNCSRQAGKSTVAAIKALHMAIYKSGSLILLVSPSYRQSGELFLKVKDALNSLNERPKMLEDNKLSMVLTNNSRIVSLPGKEQTIRGFSSVDLLIEDEAARVPDELYYSCKPMLAVSGGSQILMSTPWGKRGHFFEAWHSSESWQRVEVPASDCPRISKAFLEEERKSMPDLFYQSEYLCRFTETTDTVFNYELVMRAISDEIKPFLEGGENDV